MGAAGAAGLGAALEGGGGCGGMELVAPAQTPWGALRQWVPPSPVYLPARIQLHLYTPLEHANGAYANARPTLYNISAYICMYSHMSVYAQKATHELGDSEGTARQDGVGGGDVTRRGVLRARGRAWHGVTRAGGGCWVTHGQLQGHTCPHTPPRTGHAGSHEYPCMEIGMRTHC